MSGGKHMTKYPYGIFDFHKITTNDYFYCDRTDKIPLLEQSESQLFIRPRRSQPCDAESLCGAGTEDAFA